MKNKNSSKSASSPKNEVTKDIEKTLPECANIPKPPDIFQYLNDSHNFNVIGCVTNSTRKVSVKEGFKEIQERRANVPLSWCNFWEYNPRLSIQKYEASLKGKKFSVAEELRKRCRTEELAANVLKSGRIRDPIIIDSFGNTLEGSRRFDCHIRLLEEGHVQFSMIDVIVLESEIDEEIRMSIANDESGVSKLKWPAASRAEAAYNFYNHDGWDMEKIAHNMKTKKADIQVLVRARPLHLAYMDSTKNCRNPDHIYFYELIKNHKFFNMFDTNKKIKDIFYNLLSERKIKDAKHIREFDKIFANKEFLNILITRGSDAAFTTYKFSITDHDKVSKMIGVVDIVRSIAKESEKFSTLKDSKDVDSQELYRYLKDVKDTLADLI